MALTREEIQNYTDILRDELVPAMGCTEPIAIAYAAAKARALLPETPEHITVTCSGNIIKNVKGVTVPNSGGQKGIEVAAVLGVTGGDPGKALEVIAGADEAARERCRELVHKGFCDVNHAENVPNLYIAARIRGASHSAEVVIEEHHTNITRMLQDGKLIFEKQKEAAEDTARQPEQGDRDQMTLRGILEYTEQVDLDEVQPLLERQIAYNSAISQEGLDNPWGAQIGKTILEVWGDDVKSRAIARDFTSSPHASDRLCKGAADIGVKEEPRAAGQQSGVRLYQAFYRLALCILRRGQRCLRSGSRNHIYGGR